MVNVQKADEKITEEHKKTSQSTVVEQDKFKDFLGGSLQYRVPHDYDINGKIVHVDYAFIVMIDGKKHNLPAPAIEAIVKAYTDDPDLRTHIGKFQPRKSL